MERVSQVFKFPIRNPKVRKENKEGEVVRNGRACGILNIPDGPTQSQAALKPCKIKKNNKAVLTHRI